MKEQQRKKLSNIRKRSGESYTALTVRSCCGQMPCFLSRYSCSHSGADAHNSERGGREEAGPELFQNTLPCLFVTFGVGLPVAWTWNKDIFCSIK